MSKFLALSFIFIFFTCKGQNLLQNGNFEDYSSCPSIFGQLNFASPWYNPTTNSPDYFNECSTGSWVDVPQNFWGNQLARSGSGYVGVAAYYFSANGREYISQQLLSPLVSGVNYYLEFYVSLSDTSSHATDGLGAYISQNAVDTPESFYLPYVPQIRQPDGITLTDKTTWTKISGFYTATGGESYVTIGNFYPDSATTIDSVSSSGTWVAYYYIDDVLLIPDSLVDIKSHFQETVSITVKDELLEIFSGKQNSFAKLFQADGREIKCFNFSERTSVSLSSLSAGIYLVWVQRSDGISVAKRFFID